MTREENANYRLLRKALERAHAAGQGFHNRTALPLRTLKALIEEVAKFDMLAAEALLLILAIGLRAVEVIHLQHLEISRERLRVRVTVGKNIQKRAHCQIREEYVDMIEPISPRVFRSLRKRISEREPGVRPWKECECTYLGRRLLKAAAEVGTRATTYCFRKAFVARKYLEFDGDLKKVGQALGHRSLHLCEAFYISLDEEMRASKRNRTIN